MSHRQLVTYIDLGVLEVYISDGEKPRVTSETRKDSGTGGTRLLRRRRWEGA